MSFAMVMAAAGAPQELARVRLIRRGHLFGGAAGDHQPSSVAALRSEVDDVVGRLDHVKVVLDHQNRVSPVHQLLKHVEQHLHV